ncbi:2127_t:CDS:2 [Funneliformis caledonium]|uniref:2127_t:CDS:1 n=1 Tax=Funneliformis caledonium TaxID=1117310 RepID=A0A9N9B1B0_9GLOM|nr:2127_t:CDS:2 [Funneliformis caledonium]
MTNRTAQDLSEKKKNAKNAASVAAPTAFTRSFILQGLALFYRTPIKLFRPLRVDYLLMARAIMPPIQDKKFSFHSTSLGMLTHAVKQHGFIFIPRHIIPPLVANSMIGAVLFTTYITVLSHFHGTSSFLESKYNHSLHKPPPFSAVFISGAIAGAAQSIVAAPLDSLKVRFEVNDLLEGKHKSMFDFARNTWKELGIASIYRGIGLTLVKDSISCGLFFGVFEFVKQQCYNSFVNEMDDLHENPKFHFSKKSHFVEPAFVLAAGGMAAISYHFVDYPLDRIRNIFLIEEAQSEYQHEQRPRLYKDTWQQCKLRIKRKGVIRFLYGDFGATILRAVPATSIGFLVFELMKDKINQEFFCFNIQQNVHRSTFPSIRNYALDTRHYNNKLESYKSSLLQRTYRKRVTPSIWKPVLFAIIASGSTFTIATHISAEKIQARRRNMYHFYNNNDPNAGDMVTYREPWIKGIFHRSIQKIENSQLFRDLHRNWAFMIKRWNSLSDSTKTVAFLIGINTIIFGMWQIPPLRIIMNRYFVHNPLSGRSFTLLTSVFSHEAFWHYGFNMLALYSFGDLIYRIFGKEQFLAFYLSSGMIASCMSHVFSLSFKGYQNIMPSLGASGAIFACLSACAIQYPDASVYLIFLPFFPIKISYALPTIMAFDLWGIFSGMTMFDHVVSI